MQLSPEGKPKAPRPEDLTLRFSERAIAELDEIKSHYPSAKGATLPALWIAQREYDGFLSADAIAEVAYRLGRPYVETEGVATFYSMYNTAHKPGRHKIELCTCLSCHVNGAYRLRDWIRENLGVGHGETTKDGIFTFEEVECLNACDRAPVMQVADEYHGPLTVESLTQLLERLRKEEAPNVVRLADEIVLTQVPQHSAHEESKPKRPRAKKADKEAE